jgi:hypothetical protein
MMTTSEFDVPIMCRQLMRLMALVGALSALAQPSLAWQDQPAGRGAEPPAAPGVAPDLNLSIPDPGIDKESDRGVRIPGIGTIGILPKFDLGLELLYGANEREPGADEKSQPSDVQLRATLKHRF